MAKLTRQQQQVFAGQAPSDMITAFGTTQTGSPVHSTDLSTLQTANYQQGWQDAIIADKAPFLEEMNGVMYGTTYQLAYLFQEGIPEWDAETEYFRGSLVKVLDGNKIKLYMSLQDRNIGHLITDPDWWEEVNLGGKNEIGDPIITLSSTLGENEIWLEGAEVSRTTYSKLFEIYGTTYGEGNGETTFNLPDFRNRTLWGADSFGYVEAGLPNITGTVGRIAEPATSGAFYTTGGIVGYGGINDANNAKIVAFNASRSSAIYGKSTTVRPPSIKVRVKTRFA